MAHIIKANQIEEPPPEALRLEDLVRQADEGLADAQAQATKILVAARRQGHELSLRAEEKGYREGFTRGRKEGFAEGERRAHQAIERKLQQQTTELLAQARRVVAELTDARANLLNSARDEMLRFALELAERIVGHIAVADSQVARQNLAKALELADATGRICIRVNPSQLQLLQKYGRELTETLAMDGHIELTADETIAPGGVKLTTRSGQIDATIQTQLDNVAEALLGAPKSASTSGQYKPEIRKTREIHGTV